MKETVPAVQKRTCIGCSKDVTWPAIPLHHADGNYYCLAPCMPEGVMRNGDGKAEGKTT